MKKHSPRPELPRSETRRGFIKRAGAATAFMIVPRAVLGGQNYIAPSDRLNIAAVGAAGKGSSDIQSVAHENIYAICDIDDRRLADTLQQDFAAQFRDKTKTYRDYREMLDSEPEIDAVLISTPDHMHAPIAMPRSGSAIAKALAACVEMPAWPSSACSNQSLPSDIGLYRPPSLLAFFMR